MKQLLTSLSLLSCLFLVQVNCRIGTRIVGGNVAKEGQFPFAALLTIETEGFVFVCGGALLNEEWVLTSGTCTNNIVNVTVSLGSTSRDENDPNRVTVVSTVVVPHPDFNPDQILNDIGLVKLSEAVEFSDYVQPIKLATINLPNILHPTVVGWGQTADDSDPATDLQYAQLNILTNEECQLIYGSQIVDNMVCLNGNNKESTCYDDSGSPLVVRPIGASSLQIVGVSSFFSGNGCEIGEPSGFTRTYPYLDWINSVLQEA
ncbi:hypothetical protein Zmor_015523 [Zophobas morio]|uniref:Peptidase S1 domain-containing protein n=1 Tax=Zophobas morio TaxID=2755281 RepID=A0AA38IJJ4_9CUCU|nr:hypothetical protein Zmor_015523 [Zophobas morio]